MKVCLKPWIIESSFDKEIEESVSRQITKPL